MKTILEYLQSGHISKELDYVDLDLPSGTLWAKMNIGAAEGKNPEDWYGLYFAWGDTKGYKASDKHEFFWENYKFGLKDKLTKYNDKDKLNQLEHKDDAAYKFTNGEFRIPTVKELEELYKYTDQNWITDYNEVNGLDGILCTSQKDKNKYIFIPAAGGNNKNIGVNIQIWGSSNRNIKYESFSFNGFSNIKANGIYINDRCEGYSIRGVLNK